MGDVMPTGAVHPVANLLPMLADDELQDLADDIAGNGLRQPITLDPQGVLLDGRNRLAACRLAGVEPVFAIYGGDPVAFILSANIQRRHLSKGQIAMAVVMAGDFSKISTRATANAANASQSMIAYARTVKQYAPDLVDAVLSGDLSLNDAYTVARWHKEPAVVPKTFVIPATLDGVVARLNELGEAEERAKHDLRVIKASWGDELREEIEAVERRFVALEDEPR